MSDALIARADLPRSLRDEMPWTVADGMALQAPAVVLVPAPVPAPSEEPSP
jgi:hypothetical protein